MLHESFDIKIVSWYNTTEIRSFLIPEDIYDDWVILTPDEGTFTYRIGEEEGIVKFGELILCPPDTKLHRHTKKGLSFLFIKFKWFDKKGKPIKRGDGILTGKISFYKMDRFSSTFSIIREFARFNPRMEFDMKEHLLMDILYLYRLEQRQNTYTTNDSVIRDAALYMQTHAFHSLSLKELADKFFLSQSQFSRKFKSAIGVSPILYLTNVRLKKAQNLLLHTNLTLDDIAQQCGYQNGFYLSRVFKKTYHMSPSKFRNTHQL